MGGCVARASRLFDDLRQLPLSRFHIGAGFEHRCRRVRALGELGDVLLLGIAHRLIVTLAGRRRRRERCFLLDGRMRCRGGRCRTTALAGINGASKRLQFAIFILIEDLTPKSQRREQALIGGGFQRLKILEALDLGAGRGAANDGKEARFAIASGAPNRNVVALMRIDDPMMDGIGSGCYRFRNIRLRDRRRRWG